MYTANNSLSRDEKINRIGPRDDSNTQSTVEDGRGEGKKKILKVLLIAESQAQVFTF